MNFVSIGDQVNETLKTLSQNDKLASGKPTFRQMNSQMIEAVGNISAEYNPDAFATNQRITGPMLSEIYGLLERMTLDTR